MTFKGSEDDDGFKILETMLNKGSFDDSIKSADYTSLGVACSCNPDSGIECMMIFGSDIERDPSMPKPNWLKSMDAARC